MTAERWDTHWEQIRQDAIKAGAERIEAGVKADLETAEQFGERPTEEKRP
jgi:predicted transcriptional regulator